jgi:hypothetical protein
MDGSEIARLRLAVEWQNNYVTQLTRLLCEARVALGDQASEDLRAWFADNANG